ncbi:MULTISPECIES: hypothetical protein [unclassified Sphingomonas]|uniref:hypothetical protein n=1 Tax=unclassified Sphingomonas TaxID=196159 RepID=UPI000831E899|nr:MULTISPECIES: hypothetical protein [unclassified Sphingomonas]
MSFTRTEPSATQWRDGAARSREWAASWAADAEWRQLIAPIDAAGTLADLMPAALALLHEPGWFEAMVAQWLAIIVATPLAEPPVRSSRDAARRTLLLHDGATATITATVLPDGVAPPARAGAGRVVRSGRWSATCYLRAGGVRIERWRLRSDVPCLVREPDLLPADRSVVVTDGRTMAQRLVQPVPQPTVMLSVSARLGAAASVHEHDAGDGSLIRVATADDGAARSQMLLRLLRALDHRGAAAQFDAASRGGTAFLRWEAMREWLMLGDATAVTRLGEVAADDPDPDVRAAAAATLARLHA